MKSVKLKIMLACVLSILLTSSPAIAATCTISGQNLVVAYSKAKGNGYHFTCQDVKKTTRGFYVAPGRLGCKGRKNSPLKLLTYMFRGKALKNGWKISDVTARGGPGTTEKKLTKKWVEIITNVPLLKKYNVYITKLKLKHASKGCSNINTVLTDAFGS